MVDAVNQRRNDVAVLAAVLLIDNSKELATLGASFRAVCLCAKVNIVAALMTSAVLRVFFYLNIAATEVFIWWLFLLFPHFNK